jgi:hypothetical protein
VIAARLPRAHVELQATNGITASSTIRMMAGISSIVNLRSSHWRETIA